MAVRNTPRRIAPWFRGTEPAVIYVDKFTIAAVAKSGMPIKCPTEPGHWWSADDGWTGPFATRDEALEDGRKFLKAQRRAP